jgi:hypothetical protein
MFILTISTLFSFVLFGMENVDEESKISFKDLVKSRLFIFVSLPYIHSAITLPITYFVLTNYAMNQALTSALYVSIINAVARFVSFIILCLVVRKMVSIRFPWKNVTKYVFASFVMAIVLVLLPQPTRIIFTVITTGIGGLVYLTLLIMIDEETRLLVRSILNEFRSRIGFSST